MTSDDLLQCQACQCIDTIDGFDVIGACPGSVFCNSCNTEISIETGKPTPLCGSCTGCQWLIDAGEFEDARKRREATHD